MRNNVNQFDAINEITTKQKNIEEIYVLINKFSVNHLHLFDLKMQKNRKIANNMFCVYELKANSVRFIKYQINDSSLYSYS